MVSDYEAELLEHVAQLGRWARTDDARAGAQLELVSAMVAAHDQDRMMDLLTGFSTLGMAATLAQGRAGDMASKWMCLDLACDG